MSSAFPSTNNNSQGRAGICSPSKPAPSMAVEGITLQPQFRALYMFGHEQTRKLRMQFEKKPEAYKVIPARGEHFGNETSKAAEAMEADNAESIRTYHKEMACYFQQRIEAIKASYFLGAPDPALIPSSLSTTPSSAFSSSGRTLEVQVRELPSGYLSHVATPVSSPPPSRLRERIPTVCVGDLTMDYTSFVEDHAGSPSAQVQSQEDEHDSTSTTTEESLVSRTEKWLSHTVHLVQAPKFDEVPINNAGEADLPMDYFTTVSSQSSNGNINSSGSKRHVLPRDETADPGEHSDLDTMDGFESHYNEEEFDAGTGAFHNAIIPLLP